jgi:ABC-type proline/glycine betaine transport system permease subunit
VRQIVSMLDGDRPLGPDVDAIAARVAPARSRAAGVTWFLRNWDQVAVALGQHVTIVLTALVIAFAIALPVGIVAARNARVYAVAIAIAGFLYTIPTLAFLALLIPSSASGGRTRSSRWWRSRSSC